MNMGTRIFLSALILALGTYGGYSAYRIWDRSRDDDVKRTLNLKPARNLDEFTFTERSGKPVRLADLKGEIYVVNFFFANCPGSCRQFTSTIAGMQTEFADEDVKFLSITVDPTTDTPERLTKYADEFGADAERWLFLNAPLAETQDLGRSLHVTVLGTAHTDEMIIVDRQGIIRGTYDHKDPAKLAKFKTDLKALLREQSRKPAV